MPDDLVADFIVVGAGSAGSALAARLSEDPANRVLLLEAGPEDTYPWIHVPMGYPRLYSNPKINWMLESEKEPGFNDRRTYQPRGKVLGGTSSINGMIYMRGNPLDYDSWRQLGCEGWSWDDVLPYFRKSENQTRGEDAFHGTGGPLTVSDHPARYELIDAVIAAGVEAGLVENPDFNGAAQDGIGYYQTTTRAKRRLSSARAFLAPARSRPNLRVLTQAHARRVLLEGRRAVGVEMQTQAGVQRAMAQREVILCAGAFGSPQLLLLSGIGPGEHLRDMDIPVRHECPAVGENLQDHFGVAMMYRCAKPITLNDLANSPVRKLLAGLQYVLMNRGPLTSTGIYAGLFARSDPAKAQPDINVNINSWTVAERTATGMQPHPFPGFTMSPVHLRPECRGTVRLGSPDPVAKPVIRFNYLQSAPDVAVMLAAMRLVRTIVSQPALRDYAREEIAPGPEVRSDAEAEAWLRAAAYSSLHPVGSCRMGRDRTCVTDPALRVHGLGGLRVVDASIMPVIVGGNTNAPTIMIAEKAVDMILADTHAARAPERRRIRPTGSTAPDGLGAGAQAAGAGQPNRIGPAPVQPFAALATCS